MKTREIIKRARKLAAPFRVARGDKFRLKDIDPGDTLDFTLADKPRVKEVLALGITALEELQDKLYADDKWALLLIFQAMDAAGKDGAIKHVMSGVNPQGCQVFSFKSPSAEDLDHDYLWRCTRCLPNRGHIGIFNRSYYEETLVVRGASGIPGKSKRFRRNSSARTSGGNVSRTSAVSSDTFRTTAWWCGNFSCTSRRRNRSGVFSSALKSRRRTGNFQPPT